MLNKLILIDSLALKKKKNLLALFKIQNGGNIQDGVFQIFYAFI
jgi:hypothetical protein